MDYLPPTKPPTPVEHAVIAIGISALLVMMGLAGLGFAFFSPGIDPEAKQMLIRLAGVSLGLGVLTGAVYWAVRRFTESDH